METLNFPPIRPIRHAIVETARRQETAGKPPCYNAAYSDLWESRARKEYTGEDISLC